MENNSNLIKCTDLNNNEDSKINLTKISNKKMNSNSEDKKDNQNQIKIDPNLQSKINNYNKIKEFLSKNANDKSYSKIIKENPDSLFEKMNEQRIIIWESMLYNNSSPLRKNSDSEILYSPLDRPDQKVIKNDCRRTRVREGFLIPGYSKILEAILTYYCNTKKICYKQGLNEIFGSLILLKYKFKNMKLSKLFDIGEVFIDQYLPNYFYEKEIFSLQSSLSLFVILLKYHEPSVYNRFDSTEIMPQMYATNSIITLMSGKLKINIVYELWERIIQSNDPLMIHFILVAHFIKHREMIINCEKMYLATLITTISINSIEELNYIFDLAFKLREKTPYSYRILANKIGFLKKNNKYIKDTYEFYKPQSIPAMPIFPLEILSITNKFTEECVDPDCKNCILNKDYNNKSKKKDSIFQWEDDYNELAVNDGFLKFERNMYNHICEKCDLKVEKNMQYILLDLRILNYGEEDDDTEKTGFLPMMINVDQEELKSEDFNKIITNRFIGERGNYHFIFLTSSTDTFSDFESKYYTDNVSELDRKKMMFGLIKQHKIDKKLNLEDAQKNLTWKEIYKLKEYDNFRITLKTNQKENFPYVGYVYGGFNEVHDMSIKYGYELLFHNENNCVLCLDKKGSKKKIPKIEKEMEEKIKNEISESLWEHKTKIQYNKINEIYSGKNISSFLCILTKYKNKAYSNEKQKILIIILSEEFSIEFFKFESKKEYRELKIENDIKEKKKKISEYYDLGKEEEDDMNKETELALFNKIFINEVKSITMDKKSRNIIHIIIFENKDKNVKKQDSNNYEIIVDFSSINDAKSFFKCFKNAVNDFKEKNK
jgi:hypothetical protein